MRLKTSQIERYYDTHQLELEGAELGQSRLHFFAIQYLLHILQWLFESRGQKVGLVSEINFYQTDNPDETPKQPDLAVVDGLEVVPKRKEKYKPSYHVGADGPPPRVVFEIASLETWQADLEVKPAIYARMGVREYFAFDPQLGSGVWTRAWRTKERLVGWRLQADGTYVEIAKDAQGRMWSEQLESWLVAQGDENLFLYTAEGELRLNKAQAEAQRADWQAQISQRESRRADKAEIKAEQEAQEKQTLAAENARLLEKLRQLEQK